ncbi:hypothetical protein DFJ73DRAFT_806250 [Zopfochytrium polystomum]|nr:hypothetical protein DFJ73DRAFT_806250 [Zopfochytrium polystomum]
MGARYWILECGDWLMAKAVPNSLPIVSFLFLLFFPWPFFVFILYLTLIALYSSFSACFHLSMKSCGVIFLLPYLIL